MKITEQCFHESPQCVVHVHANPEISSFKGHGHFHFEKGTFIEKSQNLWKTVEVAPQQVNVIIMSREVFYHQYLSTM